MYKVYGKYIDLVVSFEKREDAERLIADWIDNDATEFGEDTSNDYWISEVE